jgi:hypothetical protein
VRRNANRIVLGVYIKAGRLIPPPLLFNKTVKIAVNRVSVFSSEMYKLPGCVRGELLKTGGAVIF